jgi:protoheme IX farnesyltransferase
MAPPPLPLATAPLDAAPHGGELVPRGSWRAWVALGKPRLAGISMLTTLVAYATARPGARPGEALLLLAGTTCAAAGALSLNQWSEREADALMRRTRSRPLPAGEVAPGAALAFSVILSLTGATALAVGVNATTALLAAATILIYGFAYTPLKRHTRWATEIGAVSGALPALMGNAAAADLAAAPGLVLALLLWFWQMPHFFALGWRHRADYRAAGFRLLPAVDHDGARTGAWSAAYAVALLGASLVPWALGSLGPIYGLSAALGGGVFLRAAWRFAIRSADRDGAATRLFSASLVYLPAMMVALVIDQCLWR